MNFTRVNPLSWGLKALLTSDQANALDIDHAKAINGDDGSTHTPSSAITILGSNGVVFDCHVGGTWAAAITIAPSSTLAINGATVTLGNGSDNTTLDVSEDSAISLLSGALLETRSGAAAELHGSTRFYGAGVDADGGAGHHVVSGGKLYVDGGGYLVVRTAAHVTMNGVFTSGTLGVMSLNGPTEQAAGSFTLADGVPMNLHGNVTIKSDGTLVTEAGSTTTLGGTTTYTGPLVASGAGARRVSRFDGTVVDDILPAVDMTVVDATTKDIWTTPIAGALTYVLKVDAGAEPEHGTVIRVRRKNGTDSDPQFIASQKRSGGTAPILTFTLPGAWADFVYDVALGFWVWCGYGGSTVLAT